MSRERWSGRRRGHAPTLLGFYSDPGSLGASTLAEAGAEGCGLAGSPRSRVPSPAARPDRRHPAGRNLQGLPREHPPVLGAPGVRREKGQPLLHGPGVYAITPTPPRQSCPHLRLQPLLKKHLPSLRNPPSDASTLRVLCSRLAPPTRT